MTSPEAAVDLGLFSPLWAGSAAEAATGDPALLQAMLDAAAALTRAQAMVGLAPARAAEVVTSVARADRFDVRDLALRARSGGNPVISLVEELAAAVRDADPDLVPYVHRGATSQDIVDTALMLIARRTLGFVLADLDRTAVALAELATAHRDTPMPGRTLTQHAVPTTFGLKAAGWRSLVLDARDRLAAVRAALPAQLGGAAGTLAAFRAYAEAGGLDAGGGSGDSGAGSDSGAGGTDPGTAGRIGLRLVEAYAAETGLAAPLLPWHTLRTPIADLASALAFTAGALGKIAADVLVLSRTEIGELAEGTAGGSSAMPHKANPVRATLIAAAARQVPALAGVLYGSMAAEDERPAGAWHAEWQPLREALRLVGGAARDAAELTAAIRVLPERMRANLDATGGLIVSERLAAVLSALIGPGQARQLLTHAIRRAAEDGLPLAEVLAAEPVIKGHISAERLRELTDPTGYPGSAAALIERALHRSAIPRET